jgi:hypothetical protein
MSSADKPKIIIDEDWKSQVEREKEQLSHPEQAAAQPPAPDALPPASFVELVTMLATQALVSLGQIPHPLSGQAELRPAEAKHFIDLLEVLEQKTAGNLSADEAALLADALHQLRLGYVSLTAR